MVVIVVGGSVIGVVDEGGGGSVIEVVDGGGSVIEVEVEVGAVKTAVLTFVGESVAGEVEASDLQVTRLKRLRRALAKSLKRASFSGLPSLVFS